MPNYAHPIYNQKGHSHLFLYRPMRTTIGIPTYRRPESLNQALASILSNPENVSQVIVASNDPKNSVNDGSYDLGVALSQAGVNFMVTESESLIDSKHKIAEYAQSDIICVMDDDAVLGKGYLDLTSHFHWKQVGAVSGTVQAPVNPGYSEWSDEPVNFPNQEWANNFRYMERSDGLTIEWYDKFQFYLWGGGPKVFKCKYLGGSGLLIRRDLLKLSDPGTVRVDKDGGIVIEGEEIDLCFSLRELDYDLLYDASRVCWHIYSKSGRQRPRDMKARLANWNYILMSHKMRTIQAYPWSLPQDD